jgi:hypothetical protein
MSSTLTTRPRLSNTSAPSPSNPLSSHPHPLCRISPHIRFLALFSNVINPDTKVPLIDITESGKWTGAILSDPDKYNGKFFAAAEGFYTFTQACDMMSKVSGKTITYHQLPDEVYKSFLPPAMKEQYYEMWAFNRDYGYYGSNQEELVQWAKEQAKGKLTGLEEWLVREKFNVE